MKLNQCKVCGMFFGWHLPIEHKIQKKKNELKNNELRYKAQNKFQLIENIKEGECLSYVYGGDKIKCKKAEVGEIIGFVADKDYNKGEFILRTID